MKCPACSTWLHVIHRGHGEYACPNSDCPEKKDFLCPEWYGHTQEEINSMYRPSEPLKS